MTDPSFLTVRAAVLAGARASGDPLCVAEGVRTKAIIDIAGRPMLAHVLEALTGAGVGTPLWLVGADMPDLRAAAEGHDIRITEPRGKGPASSLLAALQGPLAVPLLVTTCDHALLTPAMVRHFVTASQASGADLTLGLAVRSVIEAAQPGTKRTYLRLGGQEISGCNLFYIASPAALDVLRFWETAEHKRKKPLSIAWDFGLWTALRLLLTRHRPGAAWALLSKRLGARIEPVLMPFGEAAIDVDKPSDLDLVRGIIAARQEDQAARSASPTT